MTDLSGQPPTDTPAYVGKNDEELSVGDVVEAVHAGTKVAGEIQALMPHEQNGPAPEIVVLVNLRIAAGAATLISKKGAPHHLSQKGAAPPVDPDQTPEPDHSMHGQLEPATHDEPAAAETSAEPVKEAAPAHPAHREPHHTPTRKPPTPTRKKTPARKPAAHKPTPKKGTRT